MLLAHRYLYIVHCNLYIIICGLHVLGGKMKLRSSLFDRIANIICLVLLVGVVVFFIAAWGSIPDQVPGHYDAGGNVTRMGSKSELVILPIMAWFLYLIMLGVSLFPQAWSTGVKVTAENRVRVYRAIKHMLSTVKLAVVIIFVFIALSTAITQSLPSWFLPASLILTFGPMAYFIIQLIRYR